MGDQEAAILVQGVGKAFRLPHERHGSIKNVLFSTLKGKKRTFEKQRVLNDISFEIKKGEFFGIVGRNGSGKSTLLKLLAGIYSPDKGHIRINGKLTPFIELGVGFNPELTGRENVFLNGALLGFSRAEMEKMYDEIVDFAELKKFMDQQLKNYSSGMQVRLAFSIAIRANTDVLLLDEVLAVGDTNFQQKCYEYFAKLKRDKKTVVLVTHDMDAVNRFCSRGMVISKGEILEIGDVAKITKKYNDINRASEDKMSKAQPKIKTGDGSVKLSAKLLNQNNKIQRVFSPQDKLVFDFDLRSEKTIEDAMLGLTIQKLNGELVYWFTTEKPNPEIKILRKDAAIKISLKLDNVFGHGEYTVNLSVKSKDRSKDYLVINDALKFNVVVDGKYGWMLQPHKEVFIKREKNT